MASTKTDDARNTGRGDALSAALADLPLDCALSLEATLTAPWSWSGAPDLPLGFYAVTRGRCWLSTDGAPALRLVAGDLVIVGPGVEHRLSHAPEMPSHGHRRTLHRADVGRIRPVSFGGGGALTGLVRGHLLMAGAVTSPWLASLPAVLTLRQGGEPPAPWLAAACLELSRERGRAGFGHQRMNELLAAAILVQAVRTHVATARPEEQARLSALTDPGVAPALELMHGRPGHPWTVADLAHHSGCSRSMFAARFASAAGTTPMRYLLECRMRVATSLLRRGEFSLKEIAHRVGYASESAFSAAFKRWSGRPPKAVRDGD